MCFVRLQQKYFFHCPCKHSWFQGSDQIILLAIFGLKPSLTTGQLSVFLISEIFSDTHTGMKHPLSLTLDVSTTKGRLELSTSPECVELGHTTPAVQPGEHIFRSNFTLVPNVGQDHRVLGQNKQILSSENFDEGPNC